MLGGVKSINDPDQDQFLKYARLLDNIIHFHFHFIGTWLLG